MADVLTNKQTKDYNYTSRYTTFPIYYNTKDKKYMYGLTSQLRDDIAYVECKIEPGDNFDNLAEHYYGRPDYYWVIADFNRIQDPLIELYGNYETIKIPVFSSIAFER